jgi:hypothetical protein
MTKATPTRSRSMPNERIVDAHIGDRVFKAAPWMVRQAQDFEGIARDVVASGGQITVHGDGLLPYMANYWPMRRALLSCGRKRF